MRLSAVIASNLNLFLSPWMGVKESIGTHNPLEVGLGLTIGLFDLSFNLLIHGACPLQ